MYHLYPIPFTSGSAVPVFIIKNFHMLILRLFQNIFAIPSHPFLCSKRLPFPSLNKERVETVRLSWAHVTLVGANEFGWSTLFFSTFSLKTLQLLAVWSLQQVNDLNMPWVGKIDAILQKKCSVFNMYFVMHILLSLHVFYYTILRLCSSKLA